MAVQTKDMIPGAGHNSYATARFNAVKHAVLSRYTVLPWEDESEYGELLNALAEEHQPQGPTEEHLVEELTGILWRKRRLRLAEAATFRDGLRDTTLSFSETAENALVHLGKSAPQGRVIEAISSSPEDTQRDMKDLKKDRTHTEKALRVLRRNGPNAYENALKAVHQDTREWWNDHVEGECHDADEGPNPWQPTAESLRAWLESEVARWYEDREAELQHRGEIRSQAFGAAFQPSEIGNLARYEVHLDRKLERTLALLLRLQVLRRDKDPP